MNTPNNDTSHDGGSPPAVARAEDGAQAWASVVCHQRTATADHRDFYALAGDMVATLHALEDLAGVLGGQISAYDQGHRVYDDTPGMDPAQRLTAASVSLGGVAHLLAEAQRQAHTFWSLIGHIGVEVDQ